MKYENAQQVTNLIGQIHKHEKNLSFLTDLKNTIIIKSGSDFIYTIGTDSEHEYRYIAHKLIEEIKQDLVQRIDNLKSMLEQL